MPRRIVGPAIFFPAIAPQKPRRFVMRTVMLVVLVISLMGLWNSAGLAQAAAVSPTDSAITGIPFGAAVVKQPAGG